ncbi:glucoamylase family protein [Bacillus sp. Marseille-Q3570]|uniref:glucoamylase family protein n=1 Tax=Bacillus sp. Marseille-Q3570 TaxID=2963522 RepID=UPI0021B76D1D|nr:glucoamylase family protein [Bacillus sp. Marseille-Q3570]
MKKLLSVIVTTVLLTSLCIPWGSQTEASPEGTEVARDQELNAIAKQTYRYFEDFTDKSTGLPFDAVRVEGEVDTKEYTSPTNIGMYYMSTIAADELGIISEEEAVAKIEKSLQTLKTLEKWNGLYYNWYFTEDGSLMKDWGQFISTVDNGWLSAGLVAVGQAYPELNDQTSKLVEEMDYTQLYDPEVGQMWGGYDVAKGEMTAHHYGTFYTEPRVASYVAIGKGDAPKTHWWKMERTPPAEYDWQSQTPEGHTETYDGVEVFEGHYTYNGEKYVPSWGGSMFEGLMPSLVLKEKELGKNALGLNNKRHVELQIEYAKEQGYDVWGMSPAATPDGYSEFAATPLGVMGYEKDHVVTPHATFLGLEYATDEAMKNIHKLKDMDAYSKYGFLDSVNAETGEVTQAYLALDQGMIMVSIANFLKDGVVRDYFHSDEIGKKPEELLIKEEFSIK